MASLTALASVIQQQYHTGGATAVQRNILGAAAVPLLISQLQRWGDEQIQGLHVSVVHSARISASSYVETIRFSADPRATPAYDVLRVGLQGSRVRILGTAAGIRGNSFETADWVVTRIPHFILYHSAYQLEGADASAFAGLEQERRAFAREFGVHLAPVVSYYVYPTVDVMRRMTHRGCGATTDNIGCADPYTSPPSIHAAIWPTYHEPIHVYELSLEPKPVGNTAYVAPLFISEGTAVALEDREADPRFSDYCSDLIYTPLDECALVALQNVQPLAILRDAGFHASVAGYAYSLGGSFVKYLILRFGYRAFGRFYYRLAAQPSDTIGDYNVASRSVYGRPIRQLLLDWTSALEREHL